MPHVSLQIIWQFHAVFQRKCIAFLCFSPLLSSAPFMSWIILVIAMFSHVVFLLLLLPSLFFIVLSVSPASKIFTHAWTSSAKTIKRFFETNWFQLFRVFERDPQLAALLAKMIHICQLISTFFNITRFCSSLHSS